LILAAATQRADPGPLGVDDLLLHAGGDGPDGLLESRPGTRPVAGQPPEQVPQVKQRSTISGTILPILWWLQSLATFTTSIFALPAVIRFWPF
jgi:hypothetical protein